ncbi:hypothetical protein [Lacrimispora sp.]|uniref:hypothetical protein n=1 Tax=Lacrimispora sp. TaxID=2719234 RepID=UPI0028AD81E4|nr:hypothetical protein [Lacrimispora sp.]
MKSVILVFALSFLPQILNAIFQIRIDAFSIIVYFIIIFMALYLGGSHRFYDKYKWWDRAIHFLSGVGFTGFGIAFASAGSGTIKLVILLFGFTFSLTLHVFWEVLEYISDCISHGNAQRWQKVHASHNHVSEKALQPAGLVDTMNDAICCIVGAGLSVLVWWFII